MKTNISIVATPFTTAESVLAVTRSAGFNAPAYSAAKTPMVQSATARVLKTNTQGEIAPPSFMLLTFWLEGMRAASFTSLSPPLKKPCIRSFGIDLWT